MQIKISKKRLEEIIKEEAERYVNEMYQNDMLCLGKQVKIYSPSNEFAPYMAKIVRIIRPANNQNLEQIPYEDYEHFDFIVKNLSTGENYTLSGYSQRMELVQTHNYPGY